MAETTLTFRVKHSGKWRFKVGLLLMRLGARLASSHSVTATAGHTIKIVYTGDARMLTAAAAAVSDRSGA